MSYSIDLKNVFSLKGKVALVTGASAGIGLGVARVLAVTGGATVYALGRRDAAEYQGELDAIAAEGGTVIPVKGDVCSEASINDVFSRIEQEAGGVDILINNAGTTLPKTVEETSHEEWDFIIDTNLTSGFLCAKRAFAHMKQQNWGRIVQIGSVVGHKGAIKGHIAYAATKSGQFGLTKTLAITGAPHNITSNTVAPGLVRTPLIVVAHGEQGVKDLEAQIPLGMSEPEDIGMVSLFLCTEAARHITAATIDINGGVYTH